MKSFISRLRFEEETHFGFWARQSSQSRSLNNDHWTLIKWNPSFDHAHLMPLNMQEVLATVVNNTIRRCCIK